MELFRGQSDIFAVICPQSNLEPGTPLAKADDLFVRQNVSPVAEQLAGRAEDELGFFAVTGGQEKHRENSRSVSPHGGKRQWCSRSGQLLAVLQAGLVELSAGRGDMPKSVIDGFEGAGERGVAGPREIGESDLSTLQGIFGLLEGAVSNPEALGLRVEGVHGASGFAPCLHW